MTPSEAHDSARDRTPEHDYMQAEIFKWLTRGGWKTETLPEETAPDKRLQWEREWVRAECLYASKFGIAFADIAMQFRQPAWEARRRDGSHYKQDGGKTLDIVLELKPKIHSVGAVLRQCEVLDHRLRARLQERSGNPHSHLVFPVVLATDPLAKTLATVSRFQVLSFGGDQFYVIRGEE